MTGSDGQDWDPGSYGRFRGLRLRPVLDLLGRMGGAPRGDVVDLGCGDGAAAPALRGRYPLGRLVGVDLSRAMLAAAAAPGLYDELVEADIAAWAPREAPAAILSNAALHWLPGHGALLPRLLRMLRPGGVLGVQMPRQEEAPSHRLARALGAEMGAPTAPAPVEGPEAYWRMLSPLGEAEAWETAYLHRLGPAAEGHPVRAFTESTLLRPILGALGGRRGAFLRAYDAALEGAYPPEADGSVLFPFRRLFVVARRP